MKVRIWWDTRIQGYRLECPYNKSFVEGALKIIPAAQRGFDPETKFWMFEEKWLSPIQIAAERIFGKSSVNILTKEKVEAASQPSSVIRKSLDEILLDFMKLLPYEAAQKAYKTAALSYHPDRIGGSMDKMSLLNSLWQRIEKELYNQ